MQQCFPRGSKGSRANKIGWLAWYIYYCIFLFARLANILLLWEPFSYLFDYFSKLKLTLRYIEKGLILGHRDVLGMWPWCQGSPWWLDTVVRSEGPLRPESRQSSAAWKATNGRGGGSWGMLSWARNARAKPSFFEWTAGRSNRKGEKDGRRASSPKSIERMMAWTCLEQGVRKRDWPQSIQVVLCNVIIIILTERELTYSHNKSMPVQGLSWAGKGDWRGGWTGSSSTIFCFSALMEWQEMVRSWYGPEGSTCRYRYLGWKGQHLDCFEYWQAMRWNV